MEYQIEIVRKEKFKTNLWSGGETTQLAIFPKDSEYIERNFTWRLSSARVCVEESVFTSLPGINRIIMIIEGELVLKHEGHHESILKPFEQDCFNGSWKTKSYGKVTDFNLMMSQGCDGELQAIHLNKKQSKIICLKNNNESSEKVHAIYCVKGQVKIYISDDELFLLNEGDIALITIKESIRDLDLKILNNIGNKKTDLIKASIYY